MDGIDEKVKGLMAKVEAKQEEINKITAARWKTSGSYNVAPFGSTADSVINIKTADVDTIVFLASDLLRTHGAVPDVVEILGIKDRVRPSYGGYSYEDWVADFKTRIEKISLNEKRAQLDKLVRALDKIVSPELRRQLDLEKLEKEIEEID